MSAFLRLALFAVVVLSCALAQAAVIVDVTSGGTVTEIDGLSVTINSVTSIYNVTFAATNAGFNSVSGYGTLSNPTLTFGGADDSKAVLATTAIASALNDYNTAHSSAKATSVGSASASVQSIIIPYATNPTGGPIDYVDDFVNGGGTWTAAGPNTLSYSDVNSSLAGVLNGNQVYAIFTPTIPPPSGSAPEPASMVTWLCLIGMGVGGYARRRKELAVA